MDFSLSWKALDKSITAFMRQYHNFGISTEYVTKFVGIVTINVTKLARLYSRFNEYNDITLEQAKNKQLQ